MAFSSHTNVVPIGTPFRWIPVGLIAAALVWSGPWDAAVAQSDDQQGANAIRAPADNAEATRLAQVPTLGPYSVFYDSGATSLSPEASATLDTAIDSYRASEVKPTPVSVGAHTDDTMEADAAIDESQARANTVRDYLVSRGVPAGDIVTEAYGASRPLVLADKGVPEPQNRRVEVTFGPIRGW